MGMVHKIFLQNLSMDLKMVFSTPVYRNQLKTKIIADLRYPVILGCKFFTKKFSFASARLCLTCLPPLPAVCTVHGR